MRRRGAGPVAAIAATHGLFVEGAGELLERVGASRLIVTDSVTPPSGFRLPFETVSIAPLLAQAIRDLNEDRSLADLVVSG